MIYRVTVKTTGSRQPGYGETFWDHEVIYCGTDLEAARVAFLKSEAADYGGGFGNSARETVIVQFKSEPDEIDDTSEVVLDEADAD